MSWFGIACATRLAAFYLVAILPWTCGAQPPPANSPNRSNRPPNVLLIVADDLKASVLGCYGDPLAETPNLDRLAARGLVFESAYCQGTWCAPSRTSFLHSRYRGRRGPSLGEFFRAQGRFTARVGKIFHMRVPGDIEAGTDGEDIPAAWTERYNARGPEALSEGDYACLSLNEFTRERTGRQSTGMPHRMFVTVASDGDGSDQADHQAASRTLELLRQPRDEPFLIAAGLVRPHYPMVAPRRWFQRFPWQQFELPRVPADDLDDIPPLGLGQTVGRRHPIGARPENQQRMWAGYYAAVSFMDEQVGRILDGLEDAGLRDNTIVVFTSDHGYHLGEHTFWQKSNLHEEVIRVPLIIAGPGVRAGRSESLVELVDLFPTLAGLAGLPRPPDAQGQDLGPVLQNPQAEVRSGALSLHRGFSWRTRDWAYLWYQDGTDELYDMRADPGQYTNLAHSAEHREARMRMQMALRERLAELGFAVPE